MPKTLLITGHPDGGKNRAAHVAAQIAEQHHGLRALVLDSAAAARASRSVDLLIICHPNTRRPERLRAARTIQLDRFRNPQGRELTFALREAVDALAAPYRKH